MPRFSHESSAPAQSALLSRLLLATVLSGGSAAAARAQSAAHPSPTSIERRMDSTVSPGDDFFGYANGGWLKATVIPAGKERWAARHEIDELTRQQITKLFDNAATQPAGSAPRKVADFRAAYLNEAAIEAGGIAPLRWQLDTIDRVTDKTALSRLLGGNMPADVDPLGNAVYRSSHLLGLSVEQGINGEKTNVAFLLQGGLGLPDREHYISAEPRMLALRTRYQEYIGKTLALAGFDHGDQRAVAVMALETAIAQSQATREASANDRNGDNAWARADFVRQAPGMDWTAFFAAARLSRQDTIVVWQPAAVKGAAALVASQPLPAWKDYLRFHLLDRYADVLPRAFAEAAAAIHDDSRPREQRAREATQSALSDALGRMYVAHYFPPEQKARVKAIVANVLAAFEQRAAAATWMTPATRTQSLAKLKTLYIGIGYPEKWDDYTDLVVDPRDPLGNVRRAADRRYRHALARLGRPVDHSEWWIAPQTVGGVLVFQQNAYDFTAALMQAPKYDPTASDAASYGAIGALIGHDASHFVDVLGAEYDLEGRERRWWTAEDSARFQALAQPLVQQFSGYQPFPDLAVNGTLTETENIADLAGLSAAFDAYRHTLGSRASDQAYVREQDREFFLGFAQTFAVKLTDDALRVQTTSNDHAPERYRVATVRNLDAWYDAFDVRPGQRLYLEPKARVRVW